MAYQSIGIGTVADDGTGDTLRSGGGKVNDNFVELYTLLGTGLALSSGISATATVVSLTAPTISGVVGGTQTSATITTLTSTTVNAGTLTLAAGSVTDSSGAINFGNENLTTTGTFTSGNITVGTITSTGATIIFEGATTDANQTTLIVADPSADRTITFPNITGTLITSADIGTVTRTMIASNAISGAKIDDEAIDSEHYVNSSIDLVHMSANSVDSAQYVDGSIDPEHLSSAASEVADGSITEAKMADDAIGKDQLKTLVTLLIKNSSGTTLKTLYAAGA